MDEHIEKSQEAIDRISELEKIILQWDQEDIRRLKSAIIEMQTLLKNPDCWEYVRLQKKGDTLFQEVVNTTRTASSRLAPLFVPAGKAVTGRPACAV